MRIVEVVLKFEDGTRQEVRGEDVAERASAVLELFSTREKKEKPTQAVRAWACVEELVKDPLNYEQREKLEEVLGEAQNAPPEGMRDGTLTGDTWTELRKFADSVRDLSSRYPRLRQAFNK